MEKQWSIPFLSGCDGKLLETSLWFIKIYETRQLCFIKRQLSNKHIILIKNKSMKQTIHIQNLIEVKRLILFSAEP